MRSPARGVSRGEVRPPVNHDPVVVRERWRGGGARRAGLRRWPVRPPLGRVRQRESDGGEGRLPAVPIVRTSACRSSVRFGSEEAGRVSHALRVAWQMMPVLSGEATANGSAAASAVLAIAGWRGIRRVCADADGIAGCRVRPGGPSPRRPPGSARTRPRSLCRVPTPGCIPAWPGNRRWCRYDRPG